MQLLVLGGTLFLGRHVVENALDRGHEVTLFHRGKTGADLFPGVELPVPDYNHLMAAMENAMEKMNLQNVEYFRTKVIQLYEMIIVRHGLMIVGLPFAGKSSALKVLAAALTELNQKGLMGEMKTHMCVINPKSVTMG